MSNLRTKPHRLPPAAYRGEKAVAFVCCIQDRKHAFVSHETVGPMIEMLSDVAGKYRCIVPVYCFMPDHLHAVLRGISPQSDAKSAMDAFKSNSGLWFCRSAPEFSWQLSYHDHIVRKAEDLRNQVRYIARNPVRAGLVEEMMSYPFLGSIGCDFAEMLVDLDESERFGRFQ